MEKKHWREGLTGYHWLVLAVAAMGWLFDTMDQWLYVLARDPALADLLDVARNHPDVKTAAGSVQAWFLFGWATGGLIFGMIGDKLGRTRTMALTVLIYAVFTGLSGAAVGYWDFAAYRFLTGLGIGGEFAAGASLIAEVFPAHARAKALGIMQACSAIGNMTAGVIGYTVATTVEDGSGWRWMFYIGLAPALLVFVIRAFVREPDSWVHAKAEEAAGGAKMGSITELFSVPWLRRRVLVGIGLAAVGVIGFWGIGTFTPALVRGAFNPQDLEALRAKSDQWAAIAVIVQNFGSFFGMLAFAYVADRIGRKPSFAIAFISCLIVVPLTFHLMKEPWHVFVLLPIFGLCTSTLFGGYAVYFPELFPTRLRATGTGFCYNVARYVAVPAPALFGALGARFDLPWAATIVASVFVLGLVILPFAPETKDQPLPE